MSPVRLLVIFSLTALFIGALFIGFKPQKITQNSQNTDLLTPMISGDLEPVTLTPTLPDQN